MRKINRQQQRKVYKYTNEEITEIEMKAMEKAIQGTLNIVYKVMKEQFGFGDKRLDRLEDGILKKLKGEG